MHGIPHWNYVIDENLSPLALNEELDNVLSVWIV